MQSKLLRRVLKYTLVWLVLGFPLLLMFEKTENIIFIAVLVVLGLMLVGSFLGRK